MKDDISPGLPLIAYRIPGYASYPAVIPAPADRTWIDSGTKGWANRCLPLRIANQSGWVVLNQVDIEVVWNGQTSLNALRIASGDGNAQEVAASMFGFGILTFMIPYLFRTPPGFNMMARGPANLPKEGASALEGITETDWLPYTFTMNWQITRRFKPVKFARGEPICMLTPIRRGDLESFAPEVRELESDAELHQSYRTWHESRKNVVAAAQGLTIEEARGLTQGHYIRGQGHLGERAHGHQTKVAVKAFAGMRSAEMADANEQPKSKGLLRRIFGG
jgi:hypothetical protein